MDARLAKGGTEMTTGDASSSPTEQDYWCNFCEMKTRSVAEYLAHSCIEELEKRGAELPPASGSSACGEPVRTEVRKGR